MSLQKGLIGHWTCNDDDISGGAIKDRSGFGNGMALKKSPTTGINSPNGEAVDFQVADGDHTTSAHIPEYNISGPFTMSIWVYLDSDPDVNSNNNFRQIFGLDNAHNPYGILIEQNRSLTCNSYVNGGTRCYINTTPEVPINQWTHIAYWFEPSTGKAEVYFNGDVVLSDTYTSGTLDSNTTKGVTFSSSGGTSGGGTFPGKLSDARLYDRKLSKEEIQSLAEMRTPRRTKV